MGINSTENIAYIDKFNINNQTVQTDANSTVEPRSKKLLKLIWNYILSGLIISMLLFIIVNFYVFASIVSLDSFLVVFMTLTFMTDGFLLLIHLLRRPNKEIDYHSDPSKVTAVIACYNGESEIGPTIENLLMQLPKKNIIIVSDASTDNTVEVAKSYGVKVIENRENMNKAFSVSEGVKAVSTPYVLILDDDVLINGAKIPTGLLEQGYSAVAFNVLPIKTDTFVNALQMFEYRASMHISKNLRAKVSAVGNVSGAIGLFRTEDLVKQSELHSGQFAGEDEQRTILSHIYGSGKGVTYSNETVYTHVPNNLHSLYRQRTYSWNLSTPELIPLYLRVLFSPKYHYLLKSEKAYNLYIFLTDPLRILFLWTLVFRPNFAALIYSVYLSFNVAMWLKTKRKDQFLIVLVYPFYTLLTSSFRFVGTFYWFKVKLSYFKKGLHKKVKRRPLVLEAMLVFVIFFSAWFISGYHFSKEISLASKIQTSKLDETPVNFEYDSKQVQAAENIDDLGIPFNPNPPSAGSYVIVRLENGDTIRSISHKTLDEVYSRSTSSSKIPYQYRASLDLLVEKYLAQNGGYLNRQTSELYVNTERIKQITTTVLAGNI